MYMVVILSLVGSSISSSQIVDIAPLTLSACNAAIEKVSNDQGYTITSQDNGAKASKKRGNGFTTHAFCSLLK